MSQRGTTDQNSKEKARKKLPSLKNPVKLTYISQDQIDGLLEEDVDKCIKLCEKFNIQLVQIMYILQQRREELFDVGWTRFTGIKSIQKIRELKQSNFWCIVADFIKSLRPTVIQENVVSKASSENVSGICFSKSILKHDSEVVLTL
jgi:hypothetical protein